MNIREVIPTDATKLAELMEHVESSSEFMLWEAGERKARAEDQLKMIKRFQKTENSTIFVAEEDEMLFGYLFAIGGNARKNKHTVHIVIGIHEQSRGKGIGTLLFKELDKWARKNNLHRLELTVVTQNKAGLALYQKVGFEIEGTKKDSLLIKGEFVDEYYMGKII